MLSYQHIYHAGGPADVHKHSALCILLEHFVIKAKPFSILDIYAGNGRYELTGEHAQKTKEHENPNLRYGYKLCSKVSQTLTTICEPWSLENT